VPRAAKGMRSMARFASENGSVFTPNGANVIRIPVSSANFTDISKALFEVTLTNNSVNACKFDGGAQAIINRLAIQSTGNGNEIERLDHYNVMATKMDQYSTSSDGLQGRSLLSGCPGRISNFPEFDQVTSGVANAVATVASFDSGLVATTTVGGVDDVTAIATLQSAGGAGYLPQESVVLNAGMSRTFCFQLRGAWFNPMLGRLLPPATGFTLQIELEAAVTAMTGIAPDYTVSNPRLLLPTVSIEDPGLAQRVRQAIRSGVSWRGITAKTHQNVVAAGAGPASLPINDRSANIRGIMSVARTQAHLTAATRHSLTKSTLQFYSDWQYAVGSDLYPPQRVEMTMGAAAGGTAANNRVIGPAAVGLNYARAFSEVQRFWGSLHEDANATGLIGAESFCQSENNNGTGVIAINLQTWGDPSMASGLDAATDALPMSLEVTKTAMANAIQSVHTYVMCDLVFSLSGDGQLTSRS
jgi:hypothetical protein